MPSLTRWLRRNPPAPVQSPKKSYWETRKKMVYLQHVYALASFIGRDAKSIIDVGSHRCPYVEWFHWIPKKVSVDRRRPYSSPTVEGIKGNFLTLDIGEFDLCLCLQVLEHIEDATSFAHKLLAISPRVLISVPFLWPAGKSKHHRHDPVDLEKVSTWFERVPDFHMISAEHSGPRRLICYFKRGD